MCGERTSPVTWCQAPRPQQTDPKVTFDSDLARLAALTTLPTNKLQLHLTIDPTWTKKFAEILNAGGLAPRSAPTGDATARGPRVRQEPLAPRAAV